MYSRMGQIISLLPQDDPTDTRASLAHGGFAAACDPRHGPYIVWSGMYRVKDRDWSIPMKVRFVDDGVIVELSVPEARLAIDHASWDDPQALFEVQLKFDSDGDSAAIAATIGRALRLLDDLRGDAHASIDTLGLRDIAPLLAPLRIGSITRHLAPGDDAVHLVTDVSASTKVGAFVNFRIDTSCVPSMHAFMFHPPVHSEEHQASTVVYTFCASRIASQHRLAALAQLMHDLSYSNEEIRNARRTTPRVRRRFSL